MDTKQACIYCASSPNVDKKYFDFAAAISKILVNNNYAIIYGGGSEGLMGAIADQALAMDGKVIGVIPEFMKEVEWDHKGVEDMIVVDNMPERKQRFLIGTDLIIALPGGCGTLEEIVEVISWKKLGQLNVPIIILNQDGFYDPLVALYDTFISQKFMGENHRGLFNVITDPSQLMESIANAKDFSSYKVLDALVK